MIAQAIAEIALRALAFVRFYPVFAGTVLAQNADGTIEWQPDNATFLPGLSKVPIRSPWPGFTVKIAPLGAVQPRCGVQFEDGDRKKPVVVFFDALLGLTTSAALQANAITFGPTQLATHPLLLGDTQKAADDALDTAISNAETALATASASITVTMGPIIASSAPTPGNVIGPPVEAINTALLALGTALGAAAAAHKLARALVLSTVTKTA